MFEGEHSHKARGIGYLVEAICLEVDTLRKTTFPWAKPTQTEALPDLRLLNWYQITLRAT